MSFICPTQISASSLSFVQDGMYPLQEDDQVESGCDEDEEEEEFDSDESLVDSDSDSEEKGAFWDALVTNFQ